MREEYVEEGVDGLALLTPLIENRRKIVLGVLLISAVVGGIALASARKYKAELSLTPVINTKSSPALGGI
ncbi:MAG: hypothetical protein M3R07_10840, partial [Gemmatimonadota bacterium]|nr:hypothetical protein [Gemmatimonadota bacterium]